MRWKRKIQKGDRIQIPSDYLEWLGLRKGDFVLIDEAGKNKLLLKFVKNKRLK